MGIIFSSDFRVRSGRELARLCQKLGLTLNQARLPVKIFKSFIHPIVTVRHYILGKQLIAKVDCSDQFTAKDGYSFFDVSRTPNGSVVVALLNRLWKERCSDGNYGDSMLWRMIPSKDTKNYPTLRNCFYEDDLINYPEIMDFMLDDMFLYLATKEIGSLPKLSGVRLAWSTQNDLTESSQLFHLDLEDNKQLKIFVNISDVELANGPLTFLPASATKLVRNALRENAPGNRKHQSQRVTDVVVDEICGRDKIKACIGRSGSGLALNTGRCLHYGSRCRKDERLVLIFQFVPANVYREPGFIGPEFPIKRYVDCPVRTAVLA